VDKFAKKVAFYDSALKEVDRAQSVQLNQSGLAKSVRRILPSSSAPEGFTFAPPTSGSTALPATPGAPATTTAAAVPRAAAPSQAGAPPKAPGRSQSQEAAGDTDWAAKEAEMSRIYWQKKDAKSATKEELAKIRAEIHVYHKKAERAKLDAEIARMNFPA